MIDVQDTEEMYTEAYEMDQNVSYGINAYSRGSNEREQKNFKLISLIMVAIFFVIMVTAALATVGVVLCTKKAGWEDKSLALKLQAMNLSIKNNAGSLLELQSQLKKFMQYFSLQLQDNSSYNSNDVAGMHPSNPAPSCSMISKSSSSGYYWVLSSSGSAMWVYCDMTRTCGSTTGGWMRVTSLNMKQAYSQCPSSLCLNSTIRRTCRMCSYSGGSCPLQSYPVGVSYSKVCGRVIAYQIGSPDAYSQFAGLGLDGVSLTYGTPSVNIWTFYAANQENYNSSKNTCPCMNPDDHNIISPPESIGNHYFCDTAPINVNDHPKFHMKDPLWDGAGCKGAHLMCCSFNNPPWFYRDLSHPIVDDIQMKVCRDEDRDNEDIAIEVIDIYVQ